MKSHGFAEVCDSQSCEWREDELPEHLFIRCDIRDSMWFHLLGDDAIPCHPQVVLAIQIIHSQMVLKRQIYKTNTTCDTMREYNGVQLEF